MNEPDDSSRREFEARMAARIAGARRQFASAATPAPARSLTDGPIALTTTGAGIVFGTFVEGNAALIVPVRKMQHMLVAGTTGYGKSVFLHQIVYQLLRSADVEAIVLIDLKGGVTFNRYRGHANASVIWDYTEVVRAIADLVDLMTRREAFMRAQNIENWRGGRVFVVIDEFADLQTEMDTASGKEEKEVAKRLSLSLTRISRRARSVGIVLVCALQKPTTDAMDSSLRSNLNCRICFRVGSSQLAASILDGLDDAPVAPTNLRVGRFIYYDGGRQQVVQTQVAPGIDLGDP